MVDTKLPALLGDWSIMIVQVLLEYSWLPCYNTVKQTWIWGCEWWVSVNGVIIKKMNGYCINPYIGPFI